MATIVDSYSETNKDNEPAVFAVHPSGDGDDSAMGQAFTGDGQKIYSCKFYVAKSGSPGNCIARLYAHTGTYGTSSAPTGNALDSSDVVAATNFTAYSTFGLYEFTGFTGYTLVNGTKYCIVFEAYDGTWNGSNLVVYGRDISTPTHGGNTFQYEDSGWFIWADYDTCFYVYGVTVGQPTMKRWGGIPYMEPRGRGVW